MVYCMVSSCKMRSDRDLSIGTRFYRIPKVVSKGPPYVKLRSERRRALWLAVLRKTEEDIKYSYRICSSHFISGKSASTSDETNPDWVPSIFMNPDESPSAGSSVGGQIPSKLRHLRRSGVEARDAPQPQVSSHMGSCSHTDWERNTDSSPRVVEDVVDHPKFDANMPKTPAERARECRARKKDEVTSVEEAVFIKQEKFDIPDDENKVEEENERRYLYSSLKAKGKEENEEEHLEFTEPVFIKQEEVDISDYEHTEEEYEDVDHYLNSHIKEEIEKEEDEVVTSEAIFIKREKFDIHDDDEVGEEIERRYLYSGLLENGEEENEEEQLEPTETVFIKQEAVDISEYDQTYEENEQEEEELQTPMRVFLKQEMEESPDDGMKDHS